MSHEVGSMLSHYRLIEKIGEGGMGVVWKALDTTLERMVAIKVLAPDLAGDREWLERFQHEARAVAALNHPNIITLHSVEEAEGLSFFTMELVPGRTLAGMIPVGGFSLPEFLDIAVPLVDAVAAAHERGIVHRDLKPANVMVSDDGRVKVLDFGLAEREVREAVQAAAAGEPHPTERGGRLSGTVPYMSPEQIQDHPMDHRSDIFSLGVILYEMATSRHPFRGVTSVEVVAAILNTVPRPVTEIRPEFPLNVSRIIRDCLEKDPAGRLASARDLHHELLAIRRHTRPGRSGATPSLGVLPFSDMSREKDQEYLCEGIAEEIINALAQVEELRVASRTSSFRFRATSLSAREIGMELAVDALLEGSVRKLGDRLRISAELISAVDGYCLWSERYDREMKDIFAIQDEIAWNIVQALKVRLGASGKDSLPKATATEVEAYEHYLRGRRYFYQYSKRGIGFALDMFARAIERDPNYAPAYAGMADCYFYLYLHVDRNDAIRLNADEASRRALDLAPDLAQAHVSRGLALSLGGRHDEAIEEFETAIRLNPRLFEAFYFSARDCFVRGRLEEAAERYETAMALRPEDYQAPLLVAQIYDDLGRHAAAHAVRRRGVRVAEEHLETHPEDVRAVYMAANGMVAMGEIERGLEWAQRALAIEPDDSMVLYNVACIRSLAGRQEEALDCLEKSVRAGLVHKGWIINDSNLDPIRGHPRYRELLDWLDAGG